VLVSHAAKLAERKRLNAPKRTQAKSAVMPSTKLRFNPPDTN